MFGSRKVLRKEKMSRLYLVSEKFEGKYKGKKIKRKSRKKMKKKKI